MGLKVASIRPVPIGANAYRSFSNLVNLRWAISLVDAEAGDEDVDSEVEAEEDLVHVEEGLADLQVACTAAMAVDEAVSALLVSEEAVAVVEEGAVEDGAKAVAVVLLEAGLANKEGSKHREWVAVCREWPSK